MLIGTDMAIFGGASRPCISLRLRDAREPINVLTGILFFFLKYGQSAYNDEDHLCSFDLCLFDISIPSNICWIIR